MLNIVLTGASGYVGQALIKALDQFPRGIVAVKALVRSPKDFKAPPFVELIQGSLANVPDSLFFDEPHVVIHFAVKQIDDDGSGFQTTNVQGTKALLEKFNAHTLGVIYGSTLSVQGQKAQSNIAESALVQPKTALAKSRAQAEALVIQKMKALDKWAFCLRPRFILGKEDRFVLPGFIKLSKSGVYIGDGQQQYSVITVTDYALVILKLAQLIDGQQGGSTCSIDFIRPQQKPLNVGYQQTLSFDQIFTEIRHQFVANKRRIPVKFPSWLPVTLKWIPNKTIESKATQLELIGFDHYGDVSRLEQLIGDDITKQDSLEKLKALFD